MKNTGLRLAITISVLYALLASFMLTKITDESTLPGASRIAVSGETATTAGEGLGAVLKRAASESHATVVREVRDLHSPTIRHFYVVSSSENSMEARWIAEDYPDFSRDTSTIVHSASELEGIDPRGVYYIMGGSDALQKVSSAFQNLGYETDATATVISLGTLLSALIFGSLGSSTLAVLLLVALLAGFSVLSRSKNYAVLRLHGSGKRTAWLRDTRQEGPAFVVIPLLLCGGSCLALYFYNGWNQLGNFLSTALVLLIVALAAVVVLYAACLLLVFETKIIIAIKGKLGFKVAVPAVYLLRIPSLILTVSLLASVFVAATSVNRTQQELETMGNAGSASKIVFEGLLTPADMDRLAFESGSWLKDQDALGNTILVQELATKPDGTEFSDQVVLVNRGYLQRNPLAATDGEKIDNVGDEELTIMLPPNVTTSSDEIQEILFSQGRGYDKLSIRTVQLKGDQPRFMYPTSGDSSQPSYTTGNSVIVAIGPRAGIISDDNYMAYASQGSVLMADAEKARADTPSDFLGSWISAYVPIGQLKAIEVAKLHEVLRVQLASTTVALFVLLATGIGLAQMHVRGNAQSILVRYLHGWKFIPTHRWLIRGEIVVLVLAMAWAVATGIWAAVSAQSVAGPQPHDGELAFILWQPFIVVIVALCNLAILIYMVNRRSRNMIRTQSGETA